MTEERLQEIQQKIHYTFKNPELLKQAFVSPSVTSATQNRVQNYQVLEFIGDAVLEYVVVKQIVSELCHITPSGQLLSTTDEGGLTEEKTQLVKIESLANVCKSNKLPEPTVSFWDNAAGRLDCIVSIQMTQDGFIGSGRSREEAQNAASKAAATFIKKQLKSVRKKEKRTPRGLLALATAFRASIGKQKQK